MFIDLLFKNNNIIKLKMYHFSKKKGKKNKDKK